MAPTFILTSGELGPVVIDGLVVANPMAAPLPPYARCRVVRCSHRAVAHRMCGGHLAKTSPEVMRQLGIAR